MAKKGVRPTREIFAPSQPLWRQRARRPDASAHAGVSFLGPSSLATAYHKMRFRCPWVEAP